MVVIFFSSNGHHLVALFMQFPCILATSQKRLCVSCKESKSHMLSILNFVSSVTHRAIFYTTLITPTGGAIYHFCLIGKFCFLPKSRPLLLLVVFAFAFHASKKTHPFGFLRICRFVRDSAAIHYKIPPLVKQVCKAKRCKLFLSELFL